MSFTSVYKYLKEGSFELLLQNAEDQIKNVESGKQLGQVLVLCSHFIYNRGTISKNELTSMMKVVILSLSGASKNLQDINATDIFKSLYYILVHGVKKLLMKCRSQTTKVLHGGHSFPSIDSFPAGQVVQRLLKEPNWKTKENITKVADELRKQWIWCNVYPLSLHTIEMKVNKLAADFSWYSISDRAGAAVASAVLKDFGIITDDNTNVIDRCQYFPTLQNLMTLLPPQRCFLSIALPHRTLYSEGLDIQMTLNLVKEIETLLNIFEDLYLSHSDLLRKIHATLWNLSLEKGLSPDDSLSLQSCALVFLCFSGENLTDVCNNCQRVGKWAAHYSCTVENIEAMYAKVLLTVITYLQKKPSINPSSVIALNLVVIEYAKSLYKTKNCILFSQVFKPLALCLESICDAKIVLSFKMSVKIVEVGMALALGQCHDELLTKILKGCSIISVSSLMANTILVDGLLFTHQLIGERGNSIMPTQSLAFMHSVFTCLMERISKGDNLYAKGLLKILEAFGNHLNSFVYQITNDFGSKEDLLMKVVDCSSTLGVLLSKVQNFKGETHIYNIGINCCNLGVIAFRCSKYYIAAEFLGVGVQYLNCSYSMYDETQKENVMFIMMKKSVLLKDSLRYGGKYKEATMKTLCLVAQGILPNSDIIPTWIKCKRDAHKANCGSLEKLCIKDIYLEVESCLTSPPTHKLNIEELLVEELKQVEQLSFDTGKEQLHCARGLMSSDEFRYKLEGSLALTKVLWGHSGLSSGDETPFKVISDTLLQLEKYSMQNECGNGFLLEYKARAYLWLYLCNLQVIQEKAEAEVEEKQKCDEPLTAQSTDLGEEVQPNDVCSIRPSTSVTTFSTQEATLQHLHQALYYWELVVKEKTVLSPSVACNDLLSIGFIYKLSGLLPSCIKAFSFLLPIAHKYDLHHSWIRGVTELMEIVPELISSEVAQRLHSLLSSESGKIDKFTDYLKCLSLSTLAYYYLKNGEFTTGSEIIVDCLSNPLMEKRTPAATEVQIGIYFVASHYAFLPSSVLSKHMKPREPCLFLAVSATRKAIGLINAFAHHNPHENVCWGHKVAWLHQMTNLWLGRLCHITAQPRLARAYLRQALTLAEKLALPLRTVELLCALAEIDLQCDQLDDCRVKIDSLDQLLKVHSSFETKDVTRCNEFLTSLKAEEQKKSVKTNSKYNLGNNFISVYADNESYVSESLRESNASPEFSLKVLPLELGNQLLVIGEEKRINHLVNHSNNQCPSSPSVGFREEKFVVRSVVCPVGVVPCPVCVTPELHSAAIIAKVAMGVIHAHRSNTKGAHQCFMQAQDDLDKLLDLSQEIHSKLHSILMIGSTDDLEFVNKSGNDCFIQSQMALAKLCLFFHWNEVLCMDRRNWSEMELRIRTTHREVSNLNSVMLSLNHPLVVQLILQGHAVFRTIQNKREEPEDVTVDEGSPAVKSSNGKVDPSMFKTPARSNLKNRLRKPPLSSNSRPPVTPFRIFTDTDSSGEKNETQTTTTRTRQEREIKNLSFSFGKLSVDGSSPANKCSISDARTSSPKFSPLSSLNSSPFSQVLQLPCSKMSGDTSTKTSSRLARSKANTKKTSNKLLNQKTTVEGKKINKMISKRGTSKTNESESVKENSPIIKVKLNPEIRAKTTRGAKCYAGKSSAAAAADSSELGTFRETRNRRNLKRL